MTSLFASAVTTLNAFVAVTILCWGVWGIFDKKALNRSSSPWDVFLAAFLLEIPQALIWMIVLRHVQPDWHFNSMLLVWALLSSCTYALSMMAYLSAMRSTEASLVLGFTAGYPLVSQLLAVAFLHEAFVPGRMAGGLLIAAGVLAIGLSGDALKARRAPDAMKTSWGGLYACVILATICWGVKGLFEKQALSYGTVLEVNFAECLCNLALTAPVLLILLSRRHKPNLHSFALWKNCALSALFLSLGGLAYLKALSISTASYVVTMTGCYPLLMYLFALVLLGERFNRIRMVGIALVVLGGVIVQLTQAG